MGVTLGETAATRSGPLSATGQKPMPAPLVSHDVDVTVIAGLSICGLNWSSAATGAIWYAISAT